MEANILKTQSSLPAILFNTLLRAQPPEKKSAIAVVVDTSSLETHQAKIQVATKNERPKYWQSEAYQVEIPLTSKSERPGDYLAKSQHLESLLGIKNEQPYGQKNKDLAAAKPTQNLEQAFERIISRDMSLENIVVGRGINRGTAPIRSVIAKLATKRPASKGAAFPKSVLGIVGGKF